MLVRGLDQAILGSDLEICRSVKLASTTEIGEQHTSIGCRYSAWCSRGGPHILHIDRNSNVPSQQHRSCEEREKITWFLNGCFLPDTTILNLPSR